MARICELVVISKARMYYSPNNSFFCALVATEFKLILLTVLLTGYCLHWLVAHSLNQCLQGAGKPNEKWGTGPSIVLIRCNEKGLGIQVFQMFRLKSLTLKRLCTPLS